MSAIHAPMFTGSDGCNDPLTDSLFSDVVLLLHGNDFTDVKGHTATVNGGTVIDTITKLFGSGSIKNPGQVNAASCITFPSSTDFNLGSSWTIEGANYSLTDPSSTDLIGLINNSGVNWNSKLHIEISATRKLRLQVYDSSGSNTIIEGTSTIPAGAFFRWRVVDDSGTYYLFVDGHLEATGTHTSTINHLNDGITISSRYPSANPWNGFWDEYRITKAVRSTSDYTLACRAFPDS